jgi:ribosomal-protein-alanine N-acetyltransferase
MLPELETDRLILRELSPEDAEAMTFQNASEQWGRQAVEPTEFADPAQRIASYLEYRGEEPQRRLYAYIAREKADGRVVGTCSLQRSHPKIASLGLSVATPENGRGYGSELARRMIAFGFAEFGLNRISADVALENAACMRVMEKAGMRREGTARDIMFAQGRWWTEAQYAILARDSRAASATPA